MQKIKAIIFDCDGTLLDTERIYLRTWELVAKPMGYDIPLEVLMDNRGKGKSYCRENLFRAMGEDFPIDEIYEKRHVMNEELFLREENVVKPGVTELLHWMKERGILSAVASAKTWKVTSEHLKHASIYDLFDVVIGGDMVSRNKPEPDSFLKAAEMLGVLPEECMVIGDTPSDMQAAKAAQMTSVFVPDLIQADAEINSLADVQICRIDNIIEILEGRQNE